MTRLMTRPAPMYEVVARMANEGQSTAAIRKRLGISRNQVTCHMAQARRRGLVAQRVPIFQQVADLYNQGATLEEIAARLDRSFNSIRKHIHRAMDHGLVPVRAASRAEPSGAAPARARRARGRTGPVLTGLDAEIWATGGAYAGLARLAAQHGMTTRQMICRWHRVRHEAR